MDYAALHAALLDWLQAPVAEGWIAPERIGQLQRLERQQAQALFRDHRHRPLLVGLFGGTGVGKSSLLNRLAGQAIARTGLERPTSHEVTLYLHRDFQLAQLPPELPLEQTRIAYHDEEARRLLAWIDMPDMDSTAEANRQLVEAWLPYLDWVLYVVSPERYHDDRGWRFLQRRGHRHAWLFVMNHWDQGRPEQLEDFRRRLREEGFADPVLLRTSCAPGATEDDFPRLEREIDQAIRQHSLELLQRLGLQARFDDLLAGVGELRAEIGDAGAWSAAQARWHQQLDEGLRQFTAQLREEAALPIARAGKEQTDLALLTAQFQPLLEGLLDRRQAGLLADIDLRLLNGLDGQLPATPLEKALEAGAEHRLARLHAALLQGLRAALARPGGWWQRLGHRLFGQLEWLLPLVAGGWAVQHALGRYYLATRGEADFLGLDFAVHSALLVSLGWLLPRLIRQRLEPRPAAVLRQGIESGLARFTGEVEEEHRALWTALLERRRQLEADLEAQFLVPLEAEVGRAARAGNWSRQGPKEP